MRYLMDASRILREQRLTFAQAPKTLPSFRSGRPVHKATIGRWAFSGLKRYDGTVVRLEAVKCGGQWVTSVEALERFFAALTPS